MPPKKHPSRQDALKATGLNQTDPLNAAAARTLAISVASNSTSEDNVSTSKPKNWTQIHQDAADQYFLKKVAPIIMLWVIARSLTQGRQTTKREVKVKENARYTIDTFFESALILAWNKIFPDAVGQYKIINKIKVLVKHWKYDSNQYINYMINLTPELKKKYINQISGFITALNKITNNLLLAGADVVKIPSTDSETFNLMLEVQHNRTRYIAIIDSLITSPQKTVLNIYTFLTVLVLPLLIVVLAIVFLYFLYAFLSQSSTLLDFSKAAIMFISLSILFVFNKYFRFEYGQNLKITSFPSITVLPELFGELNKLVRDNTHLKIKCDPILRIPTSYELGDGQVVNFRNEYSHDKPSPPIPESLKSTKPQIRTFTLVSYFDPAKNKWINVDNPYVRHYRGGIFMMSDLDKTSVYRATLLDTLQSGHSLPQDDTSGTNGIKFIGNYAYVKNGNVRGICPGFQAQYHIVEGDKTTLKKGLVYILLVAGPKTDVEKNVRDAFNKEVSASKTDIKPAFANAPKQLRASKRPGF